jgi:Cys-rich protein (TIGR01571 family)
MSEDSYSTVNILSDNSSAGERGTGSELNEDKHNDPDLEATMVTAFIPGEMVVNPKGKWKDGLCDCFNNIYPSMCCVVLTPTVYMIHVYQGFYGFSRCSIFLWFYIFMNMGALLSLQYTGFASRIFLFVFNVMTITMASYIRTAVRHKGNIPGGECEDACVAGFLFPCSLAQTGRTLFGYDKICDSLKTSGDANYSV